MRRAESGEKLKGKSLSFVKVVYFLICGDCCDICVAQASGE